jgi:hypothetical protein
MHAATGSSPSGNGPHGSTREPATTPMSSPPADGVVVYQLQLKGRVAEGSLAAFQDHVAVRSEVVTMVSGTLPDLSAVTGLLRSAQALGLDVVAIHCLTAT